jgi:predicted  nucleic acid-binding Zn-ribbon protein
MDEALATIRNDKAKLTSEITELHRRMEAVTKTMLKEKASIEQQITQLTGKPLEIQTQ